MPTYRSEKKTEQKAKQELQGTKEGDMNLKIENPMRIIHIHIFLNSDQLSNPWRFTEAIKTEEEGDAGATGHERR